MMCLQSNHEEKERAFELRITTSFLDHLFTRYLPSHMAVETSAPKWTRQRALPLSVWTRCCRMDWDLNLSLSLTNHPHSQRSFRFSRICRFYLHSSPGLGFSLGFRRRNKWLWLPVWWTRVSDGFVIKRNFHFKVPGTVINLLDRPFYNLEYNLLDCNGF